MKFDETDVRRAFEKDEFYPAFQPIVEFRTGVLAGFEVLARWNHGKLGAIWPDQFIPSIEKTPYIHRLTQTILEKAFAAVAVLNHPVILSVNISPLQLVDYGLPERIAAAAALGGFSTEQLTIEITESALVDDLPRAQAVARELKALHCRLALDDFGTGYSSLKHLHALPFDELKVDRSFVSAMTEMRESRKIVASVVGLGQSLGLITVAEGVETAEQANMLFWMGCNFGQGWLYSKPAPAAELAKMVSAKSQAFGEIFLPESSEIPIMSLEALPAQRLRQLQAIYDGAPVGLCLLDQEMRYVSLNRRLAQMNGAPAAAHLGKTPREIIPRVFRQIEPFIRRALAGNAVQGVEIQKPPAVEGEVGQTLMIWYQPVRDEADEVLGVSVAIIDVTERKRAELALQESEVHYRHMMSLSPHVPWVLNPRGEVSEASPRWEDFTGQSIGEALGNGWLKMLHPDDVAPTREAIRVCLETGRPIDMDYRVRRPGGEWTWMRSRGSPRFGPTGKLICIYGVVEEVHAQRQTSEELQTCQAQLRATLDAVPSAMILADAVDGGILLVNQAAQRLFGAALSPGVRLVDYGSLGLMHPGGQPLTAEEYPLAKAILHGEALGEQEFLLCRAEGTTVRLKVSAKPIHAEDGQQIGGLMMARELESPE